MKMTFDSWQTQNQNVQLLIGHPEVQIIWIAINIAHICMHTNEINQQILSLRTECAAFVLHKMSHVNCDCSELLTLSWFAIDSIMVVLLECDTMLFSLFQLIARCSQLRLSAQYSFPNNTLT